MATTADFLAAPAARVRDADAAFFAKMMLGLALFIAFGFAQFEARGLAPFGLFPWVVHAHAAAMVAWLALLVAQPRLVANGSLALHRRVGWLATALLAAIVVFGSMTGVAAVRLGFVPPFFTPAYFLALVHVGVLSLAAMVAWAIAMRRSTDWHRRLIVGSTILIMEPALGRLLPMPLIVPWGEWLALAVQLGALGFLVAHDRRTLGRIHPATLASGIVVIATHVLIEALALFPPLQALAASIAAA
jgi:hypothetical protein